MQKAGDSLIAAEIRAMREREEELKRSRSELGLPTLEVGGIRLHTAL